MTGRRANGRKATWLTTSRIDWLRQGEARQRQRRYCTYYQLAVHVHIADPMRHYLLGLEVTFLTSTFRFRMLTPLSSGQVVKYSNRQGELTSVSGVRVVEIYVNRYALCGRVIEVAIGLKLEACARRSGGEREDYQGAVAPKVRQSRAHRRCCGHSIQDSMEHAMRCDVMHSGTAAHVAAQHVFYSSSHFLDAGKPGHTVGGGKDDKGEWERVG